MLNFLKIMKYLFPCQIFIYKIFLLKKQNQKAKTKMKNKKRMDKKSLKKLQNTTAGRLALQKAKQDALESAMDV